MILELISIYSIATAQSVAQPPHTGVNQQPPEAATADRDTLLGQLGPEERHRVLAFESKVS